MLPTHLRHNLYETICCGTGNMEKRNPWTAEHFKQILTKQRSVQLLILSYLRHGCYWGIIAIRVITVISDLRVYCWCLLEEDGLLQLVCRTQSEPHAIPVLPKIHTNKELYYSKTVCTVKQESLYYYYIRSWHCIANVLQVISPAPVLVHTYLVHLFTPQLISCSITDKRGGISSSLMQWWH